MTNLHVVHKFAKSLDNTLFDEARIYMHDDCHYFFRDSEIKNADDIIQSYRKNYEEGSKKLDEIVFISRVEEISNNIFIIHYTDRLRKGSVWHEHHCQQKVEMRDGKIAVITHTDLPGEAERLKAFIEGCL